MNQPAVVGVSGTPKLADKMAQFDAKKFAGKASQISYFHLAQACFLCTFEKTQGQNNSMFWPLAKNSRIFFPKNSKL